GEAPAVDPEGARRRDDGAREPVAEQHAHVEAPALGEPRAGVVVGEDLPVAPAVGGEALRAVLAHADAVAPATALEGRDRHAAARPRERRGHAREHDETADREEPTHAAFYCAPTTGGR